MIVHRDYMDSNDSVIKIYPERIEFFNPGRLAEGLSVEKLLRGNYISAIRNKQIASMFKEANIIEKYSSGIKRIIDAVELYNLPLPRFEEVQNGFRVTVFKATQKATQKTTQKTNALLYVLDQLKIYPEMTRKELASALGKSENTIKEHLARLKAEGLIERIGSDRKGYWKVL